MLPWLISLFSFLGLQAQHLPHVLPEEVGLSSSVLALADSAIQSEISQGQMPGAVFAVVRHGKMAYLKAYGHRAVYPKTEQMTTNTIFDMASCSKPVGTATSAMVLLQEGRFRLLDAVNKYIPEFQDWKPGTRQEETIRIIHLLTHTSGLPAYASWKSVQDKYGAPNPQGLMKYISEMRRDTCPEVRMRYSCLNYITMQNIIQAISGQSLKDFAAERVFRPLGMYHTGYQPADSLLPLIAPTERQPDGSVLRGVVHDPLARICNGGISGNAGLFTCAEDLGIYIAMLLNNGEWNGVRLLSPATVRAMTTEPAGFESFGRSLGWDLHSPYASCNGDLLSQKTYGHTGYTGPSIVIDPEADLGIILLTNRCHPEDKHSLIRLRSVISNIVAASVLKTTFQMPNAEHYTQRLQQFAQQPITSQDIVMLGNSLTEGGGDWEKRLDRKHIVNRGIVGDEALGILNRLDPIVAAHPQRIYLMVGINDVSHQATTDSIVQNIGFIINKIRKLTPQTKLYVQSLLPINETFNRYQRLTGKTNQIPQINKHLEKLAQANDAQYLDLFPLFTEKSSLSLRADLTTDGLHLNKKGYDIWAKALKKTL
ncbi:MAG: serine hydrolase [Bacteroidaceae bacterium]|nr:serine hydrolase [Bacteroidaceae bacterium]